jgi:hypothetical protein
VLHLSLVSQLAPFHHGTCVIPAEAWCWQQLSTLSTSEWQAQHYSSTRPRTHRQNGMSVVRLDPTSHSRGLPLYIQILWLLRPPYLRENLLNNPFFGSAVSSFATSAATSLFCTGVSASCAFFLSSLTDFQLRNSVTTNASDAHATLI